MTPKLPESIVYPPISVAMATYNGEKYLEEQLDSILSQSLLPSEIIVCDDQSTDGTQEILDKYQQKGLLKYFVNDNRLGFIGNFKRAVSLTSTDNYIALSDQDDIWYPTKVKEYLHIFLNDDFTSLIVSDIQLIDKDGYALHRKFYKSNFKDKLYNNIIQNNFIGCSMAFRKEVKNFILPFPHNLAMHDWWIGTCCVIFGKVSYIDKKLIYYRRHDNNFTKEEGANLLLKLKWRINLIVNLVLRFIKIY